MNNKNKNLVFVWFFLVCFILNVINVNALMVSPAKKTLYYEENFEYSGSFIVTNEGGAPKKIIISIAGELSDYLTLDKDSFNFGPGEIEKIVNYFIKLPNNLVEPGDNSISLFITESDPSFIDGTGFDVSLRLLTSLIIKVPFPGKYIETSLRINEVDSNGNIIFIVPVTNKGSEIIDNVNIDIIVKNVNEDILGNVKSFDSKISPGRNVDVRSVWKANVGPGKYFANVIVNFDGKKVETSIEFLVGEKKIGVDEIMIRNFEIGDSAASFGIKLHNLWNEDIEDVYATVYFYDTNGNLLTTSKTKRLDILSNEKTVLEGYLDTLNLKEGTYDTKVVVFYGEKSFTEEFKMEVTSRSINFEGTGMAIGDINYSVNSIFVASLVILVFVNILWILYFSKRKNT